jgi:hypothetical protein
MDDRLSYPPIAMAHWFSGYAKLAASSSVLNPPQCSNSSANLTAAFSKYCESSPQVSEMLFMHRNAVRI